MFFRQTNDSPLLYDKNRKTFILILATLIGLLYLMAIAGNGLRSFITAWTNDPTQECYIVIPYSGNAAQLKIESTQIEEYLKKSPLVKSCKIVDENDFKNVLISQSKTEGTWIDSMPLPVFIEIAFNKTSDQVFELLENQISEISENAQIHTQLRYSNDFVSSLGILNYVLNGISIAILVIIFAVIALMIKSLFTQQESNIEKLTLLGVQHDYISKLYCKFIARCIINASIYGFISAIIIISIVCAITENMNFFPYGFAIPSIGLYISIPLSCLAISLCITYLLVNNLQKKQFLCA